MNENDCQLLYVLLHDATLFFASHGRVENLKQILREPIFIPVSERIFRNQLNFLITHLHWHRT
jgi:hypothetical protein